MVLQIDQSDFLVALQISCRYAKIIGLFLTLALIRMFDGNEARVCCAQRPQDSFLCD